MGTLDPNYGILGPYLQNVRVFKCPSDRLPTVIDGKAHQRLRSYSMNGYMGMERMTFTMRVTDPILNRSDLSRSNRADVATFIDTHADTLWASMFEASVCPRGPGWINLPASRHVRSTTVSFVDGHGELHRLVNPSSMPPEQGQYYDGESVPPKGEGQDLRWFFTRLAKTRIDPF